MSEDMSEIMQKMNDMIKNNQIPDNIKNILNNFNSNNANDVSSNSSGQANSNNENNSESTDANEQNTFNIDMNTMLKMKSIIDNLNRQANDPRANLLRSLKPYLKPSRKDKVDQYIKLFSMGKAFEMMDPLGGKKEK